MLKFDIQIIDIIDRKGLSVWLRDFDTYDHAGMAFRVVRPHQHVIKRFAQSNQAVLIFLAEYLIPLPGLERTAYVIVLTLHWIIQILVARSVESVIYKNIQCELEVRNTEILLQHWHLWLYRRTSNLSMH